ncbi:MAG: hypothetical protein RSE38_03250 [Acinetobacter sp.]
MMAIVKAKNRKMLLTLGLILGATIIQFIGVNVSLHLSFLCLLLLFEYILIVKKLMICNGSNKLFDDGRFYVFTFMFMYSFIVPIYALLVDIAKNSIKVIDMAAGRYYSLDAMISTVWMSVLLFAGIYAGLTTFSNVKFTIGNTYSCRNEEVKCWETRIVERKKAHIWFAIATVSTLYFLTPFIRGGFGVIKNGGSILDVNNAFSSQNESILGTLISMLLGSDTMMLSTIAYLYHFFKSNAKKSRKAVVCFAIVAVHFVLMFATSRRAYSLMIIICACILYMQQYHEQGKKLPILIVIIMPVVFVVVYFAQGVIQNGVSIRSMSFADILFQFDGFGPYDALLRASGEQPNISMISNVIYGMFRNIPLVGKYIVGMFGIDPTKPPLYKWMAERYSVYAYGGGLAYMPQLEAYVTCGYVGCFVFGSVYGSIFSRRYRDLANYFVIAISMTIARGSLQVLFAEFWIGIFICYFIYERILVPLLIGKSISFGKRRNLL